MLPDEFIQRLKDIIPAEHFDDVLTSFDRKRERNIRINTLKLQDADVVQLTDEQIIGLMDEGKVYAQERSSMLPAQVLNPQPGEYILDLCAAPGSKTSQMAAMMNNEGAIVAIEVVRKRMYRLKSVLELLGVENAEVKCMDGRRFQPREGLFDKVLVDAPCSSEGRFKSFEEKSYAYWSARKIKEMVRKQRGLLLNATRCLKPGGVLVYSTCTFAPEENEGVVDWCLRKAKDVQLESMSLEDVKTYPVLNMWGKKTFDDSVKQCLRVLPNETMEGFFIAKFSKTA